ncbi:MAG: helix-turn-helix domain-containing protein, partial [Synechococcaceae bacterium WBB_3_034]|nr:helix-turn-helix domain-containing protein [Synechococcaceae bacterium WBB_3_034]
MPPLFPGPAAVTTLENGLTPALESLGSSLREARLSRGLELAQLAAQLRMGEEQLQALEQADQARLPELVFVIAQARRVASLLDLDIDPLVTPLKKGGFTIKPAPAPLAIAEGQADERRPSRLTASQYTEAKASQRQRPGPLQRLAQLA